ncbi:MAG: ABC transporter permease [Myxococcaceae bacterium]|nr:ABC transporter permease [Myxococcaceae bacterium]
MKAPLLAWRSLWRHPRRTVFCVAASGLGLFFALVYIGLTDGMVKDASDRVDRTGLGHVVIEATGFKDEQDIGKTFSPSQVLERLELGAGRKASARVLSPALVATAWGTRGVELLGVDPVAEAGVSEAARTIVAGQALAPDDVRGIVLGRELAKKLKVGPGGKVRVTVQRPDGELGAELFRVRGLAGGPSATMGGRVAYVTSAAARQLLGLGEVAHQVVLFLPDGAQADEVAASLRARLGPAVEVRSLGEFLPVWRKLTTLLDVFIYAVIVVLYVLVGLGILNVMLMSVLERTQEFGVMLAIGTRPAQVVRQVLFEGMWIACIAVVLGLALGLPVNAWGAQHGLMDYRAEFGEVYEMSGVAMSMQIKTVFSLARALETSAVVWLLTVLVGVYPAWRVSRLEPSAALRKS